METERNIPAGLAPTLLFGALLAAWSIDFLFWQKPAGISFPLFVAICVGIGLYAARRAEIRPSRPSQLLAMGAIILAALTTFRDEPFSRFVSGLGALGALTLLAHTLEGGAWLRFGFADYLRAGVLLAVSALALPIRLFARVSDQWLPPGRRRHRLRGLFPWLRGVGLALPAILFFALLLSAADPIFADLVTDLLEWFDLENLAEYLFRLGYIVIFAYLLSGLYDHSLVRSGETKLVADGKPWIPPFLSIPEAAVVLGGVDLLFAAFVTVQFRYFFGGQVNVSAQGLTYAEYARQGFAELVAVSCFSFLLFFSLNSLTRRKTLGQRRTFSILSAGLVFTNLVILASAFQRLLLYEGAFGFTRLRTYTHVFMIWLGALLLFLLLLDMLNRTQWAALGTLGAALAFVLSLNALNVDAFIVRQNVARVQRGAPLDTAYLSTLSLDAAPPLAEAAAEAARDPEAPDGLALAAQRAFACHARRYQGYAQKLPWQSFHFSRLAARGTWQTIEASLFEAGVIVPSAVAPGWVVPAEEGSEPCSGREYER